MVRRLLFGLLLLLALTAIALGYVALQAVQPVPALTPPPTASPQQVQAARAVAKRTLKVIRNAEPARIQIGHNELEALPSLVARAYPRLHTLIRPSADGVQLIASLELPPTPLGRYLSVSARIPAGQPLQIKQLQIGALQIPDRLVDWLLPHGLALLLGTSQRDMLLDGVQIVDASPERLILLIHPPQDPKRQLGLLMQRVHNLSSDQPPLDSELVAGYYRLLLDTASSIPPSRWVSLTQFVAPLFREVARGTDPDQAAAHNRAAIMALALYLGSHQFEQLTGPVLSERLRRQRPHQRTLLRGRADLRLHFVYSAAIQAMAQEGLSYAMGEFKELLDSNRGGSGFSFADLAADRAGTLFASRATADAAQAAEFLRRFDQPLRESDMMIAVDQLPEGLTEAQFAAAFADIDGQRYRQLVATIDRQLLDLRLYRDEH